MDLRGHLYSIFAVVNYEFVIRYDMLCKRYSSNDQCISFVANINPILGYLGLGYSTPFLSLGTSYMYPSLASAKSAVISVGEEIATLGLPSGLCPFVFVFTGTGNGMLSCLGSLFEIMLGTFSIFYTVR